MTDQDPTQRYEPPAAERPQPPRPAGAAAAVPPPPPRAARAARRASRAAAEPPCRPGPSSPRRRAPASARARAAAKLKWLVAGRRRRCSSRAPPPARTLLLTSDSGDPGGPRLDARPTASPTPSSASTSRAASRPSSPKVMKAFPGFEDQAAFPIKLDEALDQLVGKATDGKQSYKTDIEPWFGGQIGVSVGPLPDERRRRRPRARRRCCVSVKDAAKATAWADGVARGERRHDHDRDLQRRHDHRRHAAGRRRRGWRRTCSRLRRRRAGARHRRPDVRQGRDRHRRQDRPHHQRAVPGGRGVGHRRPPRVRLRRHRGHWPRARRTSPATASRRHAALPASLDGPDPAVGRAAPSAPRTARSSSRRRSPHVATAGPGDQRRVQAARRSCPPTTVVPRRGPRRGRGAHRLKDQLAAEPELKEGVEQVDDALAIVGGFEAVDRLDRRGRRRGHARRRRPSPAASSSSRPTPPPPSKLFTPAQGLHPARRRPGRPHASPRRTYNGTTITVVDLSGPRRPGRRVAAVAVAGPGDLKLAYAVTDEVVVFGIGTDFVKGVIDARAGESLADTERFSDRARPRPARSTRRCSGWTSPASAASSRRMVPSDRPGRLRRERSSRTSRRSTP